MSLQKVLLRHLSVSRAGKTQSDRQWYLSRSTLAYSCNSSVSNVIQLTFCKRKNVSLKQRSDVPNGQIEEKDIGIIYQKQFCKYFTARQTSRFTSASKKGIIDIDETVTYAARYIKYRGFRKCAVWRRGYCRSFRIGISSFVSRDITSMESFSVFGRRKTLQI